MTQTPFNLPSGSYRLRPSTSQGPAMVLRDENVGRHPEAYGLMRPVVMVDFATSHGGHQPGEHDGLRDGYAAPRISYHRLYVSLDDWLAAGNADPRS